MNNPTALEFKNVRKKYFIQERSTPRLGAWVVDKLFEHLKRTPYYSLDDMSFSVPKGQMLGFLGKNGAGKSTTLKLAAGITQPTEGFVSTRGRICSMLELGVGFHPDLSGMENIFYNGIILGLTRHEILEKLERIVAFSGLSEQFLLEPVKHYSSGMYSRLACSVSMHLDPDILLIDEVFSVGDADFQQKGIIRILELNEQGVTVLLVSHILSAMRDLCHRLIWIDQGKVKADDEADEVIKLYRKFMLDQSLAPWNFMRQDKYVVSESSESPDTSNFCELKSLRVLNEKNDECDEFATEEKAVLEIDVETIGDGADFVLEIFARWPDGRVLFRDRSPMQKAGTDKVRYVIERWPFLQTPVHLNVGILDADQTDRVIDRKLDWKIIQSRVPKEIPVGNVVLNPKSRMQVMKLNVS